ncbi:sulfurtransferase-like selenium metabolism protein YedF [Mesoterricola sediminis]|uniref:SirA-like protein n=1 Tax=Mesoterricola sediminis TaxID=2927980 RepID=A0AA48KDV7_9BACT|nr:sulfurtransferase-like selenium metabolism protein YedF [Mesoterricola sediminis]BDU78769.1 SirA-like protein [Mesoterricola sediminis]
MSPAPETLDTRGLACPQPVILVRKALAERGRVPLEVLADAGAARENLLKFAAWAQVGAEVTEEDGWVRIRLTPAGAPGEAPAPAPAPSAGGATVLVASDAVGQGDETLGRLLMRGFLYTLTEAELPPARVILMNAGVKLAVDGSESLASLRRLEELGVEVLACGTCLDFYKLTPAVGRVTNMYEIAGHLLQGPAVRV